MVSTTSDQAAKSQYEVLHQDRIESQINFRKQNKEHEKGLANTRSRTLTLILPNVNSLGRVSFGRVAICLVYVYRVYLVLSLEGYIHLCGSFMKSMQLCEHAPVSHAQAISFLHTITLKGIFATPKTLSMQYAG